MKVERAFAVLGLALAVLALAPVAAVDAGRLWGLADSLGLWALLGCVGLTAWPVRPRVAPTPPALPLARHRLLGFVALLLAGLHTAGLLWIEPELVEHLLPTAPLFMIAGLVALLVLAVLCVTGLWAVRRHFPSSGGFQIAHIGLGVLLLAGLGVHAVGAARYLRGPIQRGAWVLAAVLALLLVLRARRHGRRAPGAAGPFSRLVSDTVSARHGTLLTVLVLTGAVALALLLVPGARTVGANVVVPRHRQLPLDFPHEQHRAVGCVVCHHNFTDHTGAATCVACHRSARTDLKMAAEPRFHGFCEGCHEQRTTPAGRRGPVRSCRHCHRTARLDGERHD